MSVYFWYWIETGLCMVPDSNVHMQTKDHKYIYGSRLFSMAPGHMSIFTSKTNMALTIGARADDLGTKVAPPLVKFDFLLILFPLKRAIN